MFHKLKSCLVISACAILLGTAGTVHAQFRYNPAAPGVVPGTQAVVAPVAPYPPTNFAYRPDGWNPYGNTYYGRAGGYLAGAAQVYNSLGQYQIDNAQSQLITDQVRKSQLDTRQKIYDQWRYEKAMTPTLEDLRERDRMNASRRARNDPPPAEIWSGVAMNTLLKDILDCEGRSGCRGPQIPLAQDVVSRLNVTTGTTNGSVSLLKQGQALQWPPVLQKDAFTVQRDSINSLLPDAVEIVKGGGGKNQPLNNVLTALVQMRKTLDAEIESFTPDEWIGGSRFINQLQDSAKLLQGPNAANYFNGKWAASGTTVGELIYNLGQKGLKFAPCAEGDEDAYNVLYRLMVNYDAGLEQCHATRQ